MFKIELLVEDKDLPKVMWALDGLVAEMYPPIPVRGAKTVKVTGTPHRRVKGTGTGTIKNQVDTMLDTDVTSDHVTMKEIMAMTVKAGGAPVSAYEVAAKLTKEGRLRRTGKGQYQVLANA